MTEADARDFAAAVEALRSGRAEDAIAGLEALADRGVVGAGLAYDRGLAYAARVRVGQGLVGDLGRAAHGFEEALRRDPHDHPARVALDEVRREIARRDLAAGWKPEEVGSPPMWRAIVVAAPGDVWVGLALFGALLAALALALRPRLARGRRLAASTCATLGVTFALAGTALGLGARHLRLHVREAVVVTPHALAQPLDREHGQPMQLVEGVRVDVIEERMTETLVHTERGDGWVARSSLRALPAFRP